MNTSLYVAMVLGIVVLVSGMVSVELGLSVAVVEIVLGVAAGNLLHLSTPEWLTFLASFGSIVLTFLAGTEVDPSLMRSKLKESVLLGGLSFLLPFAGAMLIARYALGWDWRPAEIAGPALSTTSLAVVYAVLVETGLNKTEIGKSIMAATFVTDIGTATALTALFIKPTWWMLPFVAASVAAIAVMPRLERWFFARYGNRVIEPELKGAFAVAQRFLAPRPEHAAAPSTTAPGLVARLDLEDEPA
jgi:Kef-type K+ transport system membrane component KefB